MNDASKLAGLRVGFGFEVGRLAAGRELKLAGAMIDHPAGPSGPGDADLVARAVLDALLSACGMPDLRTIFPGDDPALGNAESLILLSQTAARLMRQRLQAVLNLNVRVLCPHDLDLRADRQRMASALAAALQSEPGQVTMSFGESSEFAGMGDAQTLIAFAHVLCLLGPGTSGDRSYRAAQPGQEARSPAAAAAGTADAPERAMRFEHAVQTRLPPLPKAPEPQAGARLIVYTDGASRGNPGPAASGWVVLDEQGRLVDEGGSSLGEHTNNQAEYMAVEEAAQWIERKLGRDFNVEFRLDSELVVRQLRGEWKLKDPELKELALKVMNLLMFFTSFELKQVPRQENRRADALANRALDQQES